MHHLPHYRALYLLRRVGRAAACLPIPPVTRSTRPTRASSARVRSGSSDSTRRDGLFFGTATPRRSSWTWHDARIRPASDAPRRTRIPGFVHARRRTGSSKSASARLRSGHNSIGGKSRRWFMRERGEAIHHCCGAESPDGDRPGLSRSSGLGATGVRGVVGNSSTTRDHRARLTPSRYVFPQVTAYPRRDLNPHALAGNGF
ncbi:MAG: hypothetical protein QOE62_2494 [Actinomycetota bacterium]|nr:hypothetical protein [Actinomycetota bacterium]